MADKQPGAWLYHSYIDPETGYTIHEKRREHSQPQSITVGLVDNGDGTATFTERQDISKNTAWEIVSTIQIYSKSWNDFIPWTFPHVLQNFALNGIPSVQGGLYKTNINYDLSGGYSGPVPVQITESWSVTAPNAESPTILQPKGGHWDFVTISGQIPVSLHAAITVSESGPDSTNQEGPKAYFSYKSFPATSPASLPSTMILRVNTIPHKGGYLKTKVFCTQVPQ